MSGKVTEANQNNRFYWVDNLRTFLIFLVVLIHTGLVYESSGISAAWWIVDDPSTNDLSGIFNLVIDIFVMATIFFISGFFACSSLKNKTGWQFLKSKFKRLMIPWAIAVLTLIPLYKVIFLYSRNLPQEHWTTYFHWSNGIWSQNWLWFLPVLFLFNLLYLLLSKAGFNISSVSLKTAIFAIFLISLGYSFSMDFFQLRGWTKTILIDFQNERLLIYLMLFLFGSLCFKRKVFESEAKNKKLYISINCVAWIPINFYLFIVIYSLLFPGEFLISAVFDNLLINLSFVLSLACLMYIAIYTFKYYLNKGGRIGRELNKNSYSVYIIHVVVMGVFALILLNVAIPSFLKHLVLAGVTFGISNLILSFASRVKVRTTNPAYSDSGRQLTHWKMSS